MYFHGSEERLIQAARGDKIDGLEEIEADWYYSRNSTISEDSFTWNG